MKNPQTIIELDYKFNENEMCELIKFLDKYYDISNFEIEIYDAKDYVNESLFADEIFEQKMIELEKEYN